MNIMLFRNSVFALALALCMALSAPAEAQQSTPANCQGGTGTVYFGAIPSYDMYIAQPAREFDSRFSCSFFSLVNIGPASILKVTASSANNGAAVSMYGAGRVPYRIYADAKRDIPLPLGTTVELPQAGLSFLGIGGNLGGSLKLYFQIQPGTITQQGMFQDTLTLRWEWGYCSLGVVACFPWSWHSGVAETRISLTLDVLQSCRSPGARMDFGARPLVSEFTPVTTTIPVNCTLLMPYKMYVTEGDNARNGTRRMKGPGDNYIEYQLHDPRTGAVLDKDSPLSLRGAGIPSSIAIEGRINRNQADVPVGTYTDRPQIVIEY